LHLFLDKYFWTNIILDDYYFYTYETTLTIYFYTCYLWLFWTIIIFVFNIVLRVQREGGVLCEGL
jgi:hypothetical protein